tara:strand:- start:82 stop:579 length:498 start_codon:yes stop_codon:yes gene_type:complete
MNKETYAKRDINTKEMTQISSVEYNEMFRYSSKKTIEIKNDLEDSKYKDYTIDCFMVGNIIYYHVYPRYISEIQKLKQKHRPENKEFLEKPHERLCGIRKRTRPWDNCWFSNKPNIINLTVEQAIIQHPQYMLWCYSNLTGISWSVHTIKIFEDLKIKSSGLRVS